MGVDAGQIERTGQVLVGLARADGPLQTVGGDLEGGIAGMDACQCLPCGHIQVDWPSVGWSTTRSANMAAVSAQAIISPRRKSIRAGLRRQPVRVGRARE